MEITLNGWIMETHYIMIKYHYINLIKYARHGKIIIKFNTFWNSFSIFKQVESLRAVERKFAKSLGIPIDHSEAVKED
jgi:hypothetical protein